jgi:hypothetical protein
MKIVEDPNADPDEDGVQAHLVLDEVSKVMELR